MARHNGHNGNGNGNGGYRGSTITNGNGNGHFFNSAEVEGLIARYKETADRETMGEIIERCRPVALSLIWAKCTMRHEELDELMSVVNAKLFRSLPDYTPSRGTAFAFVSKLTTNMLSTVVTRRKKLAARYSRLDTAFAAEIRDQDEDFDSTVALDDIRHKIRSVRSPCTDPFERGAQKWYVESFLDSGFEMFRCEVCDAAMKVYGLSHRRSRELYDLTLLEIRRALWNETKHAPVEPQRLKGSRGVPLLRYTNFLTREEFSKFAQLMRELAPNLVVLVKPENGSRIMGGEWSAVRENLKLILDGNPAATPLF